MPPKPAPPEATAELGRTLDASNFGLATIFVQPRSMADPTVLAEATAMTRSKRPRSRPAPVDHPPIHPEADFPDPLRAQLTEINRRILNIGTDLGEVDAMMAAAIAEHLDSIGLENITRSESIN